MALALPTYTAPASAWELHDYKTIAATSAPAAGGVATLEVSVEPDELWVLDHAMVTCDSPDPTSARVYIGGVSSTSLLAGTGTGNLDEADWPAGLYFDGRNVVVQWTDAADGAVGTLTAQLRILRKV